MLCGGYRDGGGIFMNVLDFGIINDGHTKNTQMLQRIIDELSASGGGMLKFPAGVYVTGTLFLKSNITLNLLPGAQLLASDNIADYTSSAGENRYLDEHMLDRCLLYAKGQKNIVITGSGEINGNKLAFPNSNDTVLSRPMMIRMDNCANIRLEGVRLIDAAGWTCAFLRCTRVFAHGLDIRNMPHQYGTADGLDFDSCQNVIVSDCNFDTGDDCICLQNSFRHTICENIAVTNCVMTGKWAGFRIGLSSSGDIRDVTISNIVMYNLGCSGLKIQATEGGTLSNMTFNNITMRNVPRSIFITLNHYALTLESMDGVPYTSRLSDMSFSNIRHVNETSMTHDDNHGIILIGEPNHPITNLYFNNIDMRLPGGISSPTQPMPEIIGCRPEYYVFNNRLPSSAIYVRHAKHIYMDNISVKLDAPDPRPLYVGDFSDLIVNGRTIC